MVDAERLRRVLQRVSDDVALLSRYRGRSPDDLLGDAASIGHVKYLFVTAIEGCIDAAQHVCASEGWGPPQTNADAMSVLARHEVVPSDLGVAMAEAVRFRNLLVHLYAEVDDRRVVKALEGLGDLDAFVGDLARLAE